MSVLTHQYSHAKAMSGDSHAEQWSLCICTKGLSVYAHSTASIIYVHIKVLSSHVHAKEVYLVKVHVSF